MPLGDLFSNSEKQRYIEQHLCVGAVFYLYADFLYDQKDKYFVLSAVCDPPLFLLINTDIHRAISARPELNECQVLLKQKEHIGIIAHDCYVDCTAVWNQFTYDDIRLQVMKDIGRIKGMLPKTSLTRIKDALEDDVRVSTRDKVIILPQVAKAIAKLE